MPNGQDSSYLWSSTHRTFHVLRRGDVAVTRRMAVEFCEDQAANGVAYTEARFSPHLMASAEVGAEEMLRAALEGFREGEQKFGTKVGNTIQLLDVKCEGKAKLSM